MKGLWGIVLGLVAVTALVVVTVLGGNRKRTAEARPAPDARPKTEVRQKQKSPPASKVAKAADAISALISEGRQTIAAFQGASSAIDRRGSV